MSMQQSELKNIFYKRFTDGFLLSLLFFGIFTLTIFFLTWGARLGTHNKEVMRYEHRVHWNDFLQMVHDGKNRSVSGNTGSQSTYKLAQDIRTFSAGPHEQNPFSPSELSSITISSDVYPDFTWWVGCVLGDGQSTSSGCEKTGTFTPDALADITIALTDQYSPMTPSELGSPPKSPGFLFFPLWMYLLGLYVIGLFFGSIFAERAIPYQQEVKRFEANSYQFWCSVFFPIPFLFFYLVIASDRHKASLVQKAAQEKEERKLRENPFGKELKIATELYAQSSALLAQHPKSEVLQMRNEALKKIVSELEKSPDVLSLQTAEFISDELVTQAEQLKISVDAKLQARKELEI